MRKRVHVFFSGTVQGVGFRYTARDAASARRLTGWVRNLRDGRVEAVCEGEESDIISFLADLKQGSMRDNISEMITSWSEATGEFVGFEIRVTE